MWAAGSTVAWFLFPHVIDLSLWMSKKSVKTVHWLDFGVPEAMWHIDVADFPAIVTMDAHGNSLHADVEKASAAILAKLADPGF